MTPREKAKELIDEYYNLTDECNCLEYSCICFTMWDFKAKQCALIAVTEILNILNPTSIEYEYWEEVEFEINKL